MQGGNRHVSHPIFQGSSPGRLSPFSSWGARLGKAEAVWHWLDVLDTLVAATCTCAGWSDSLGARRR